MPGLSYLPSTSNPKQPDPEPQDDRLDKLIRAHRRHEDVEMLRYLMLLAVIATAWVFR